MRMSDSGITAEVAGLKEFRTERHDVTAEPQNHKPKSVESGIYTHVRELDQI